MEKKQVQEVGRISRDLLHHILNLMSGLIFQERDSQLRASKIAGAELHSPIVGLVLLPGGRDQMSPSPKEMLAWHA